MGFERTDANDAGLLRVAKSLRDAADSLCNHVAKHNAHHDDHGVTECGVGTLFVAELLNNVAVFTAHSAANLLDRHMQLSGLRTVDDDDDDGPIDYYPTNN